MSLAAALEAARIAGQIQRDRYGRHLEIRRKGAVDLVTEADLACEQAIRAVLLRHTPGAAVLGEEGGLVGAPGGDQWIVDPLDGTTNYAHGYPAFCVSIAWHEGGRTQLGVVYDPLRDEMFRAQRGAGVFCNDVPIRVSAAAELDQALLATGFPYDRRDNPRNNYRAFCHLTDLTQGVRRSGSAALDLAYVACGRLDGFWELGLKPWDLAAGVLLVEEAGGQVTGLGGEPFCVRDADVLSSNTHLHPALVRALEGKT